ncbi:hypothetical protein [Niabella aquatica]
MKPNNGTPKSEGDPIIIQSTPVTVITNPSGIGESIVIKQNKNKVDRTNLELILDGRNTLLFLDIVMLVNDPVPTPEFKINFVDSGYKNAPLYSNRYGSEFLNIPDDYFILDQEIDTSKPGLYIVRAVINPARKDTTLDEIDINLDYPGFLIIGENEAHASELHCKAMENLELTERPRSLSGSPFLRGLLGFSPLVKSLLINEFQHVINSEITGADQRNKLELPQGHITKNELYVWALQKNRDPKFASTTIALFLAIIPVIYSKKAARSKAEQLFIDEINSRIQFNRATAAAEAIDAYNEWKINDRKANEKKLPTLLYIFSIGETRPPDKFLKYALAGIPVKFQDNALAALVGSALAGLAVLGTGTGVALSVSSLMPFTAPIFGAITSGVAIVAAGVAAGLSVLGGILVGAIERIVHDSTYADKLEQLYEDAAGNKEIDFIQLLKKKEGIAAFTTNMVEITSFQHDFLQSGASLKLPPRSPKKKPIK